MSQDEEMEMLASVRSIHFSGFCSFPRSTSALNMYCEGDVA
jgi:hypothetical protein